MTIPPPLAFELLTAAISPAAPPPGPEHGTILRLEARAVAPPKTATTADAATTADTLACQVPARSIQDSLLSAAEPRPLVWPTSLGTGAGRPSAKDSLTPKTWPPSDGPGKNPRPSPLVPDLRRCGAQRPRPAFSRAASSCAPTRIELRSAVPPAP